MYEQEIFITIPPRANTPETKLFIKIVAEDEASLKTKPWVFMLPGGPGGNHDHYQDYMCLSDVANIIFYDPRGCGKSDKGEQTTYTMQNYIDDLEFIRQHLKLDTINLIGKSYGAMSALAYTLQYPAAVERLVLAAGSPSYKNLATAKKHVAERGTAEQKAVCEKLFTGSFESDEDLDHFFGIMAPFYSWRKRQNPPLPVNRPEATLLFAHAPLNQGFSTEFAHFDFEDRLHEVTCDTLILVGDEDWITDKQHSELMAQHIPNNELVIFKNSDHSMESDVPELFFEQIREFIKLEAKKKMIFNFFLPAEHVSATEPSQTKLSF